LGRKAARALLAVDDHRTVVRSFRVHKNNRQAAAPENPNAISFLSFPSFAKAQAVAAAMTVDAGEEGRRRSRSSRLLLLFTFLLFPLPFSS
jgi:hypothetical protein